MVWKSTYAVTCRTKIELKIWISNYMFRIKNWRKRAWTINEINGPNKKKMLTLCVIMKTGSFCTVLVCLWWQWGTCCASWKDSNGSRQGALYLWHPISLLFLQEVVRFVASTSLKASVIHVLAVAWHFDGAWAQTSTLYSACSLNLP